MRNVNFMMRAAIVLIFSLSCINAMENRASQKSPLHNLSQDEFNVSADKMKFKELLDFALVDRESKSKVKQYFEYRKGLIKNMKCPVITKKFLEAHEKEHTPTGFGQTGFSGMVPMQRKGGSESKRPYEIVNLDGINWAVTVKSSNNWYAEALKHSGDIYGERRSAQIPVMFDGAHDFVKCIYKISQDSTIELHIFDEYLKLD